ncbi:ABC transporter [Ceratobasidium sp. AG-Ba]|nr:ABC transporter [Ceratobasidium sp. AG-Ba]
MSIVADWYEDPAYEPSSDINQFLAFALFFAYVFEIFSRPDNLGFGRPAPIASLSDTWTADTIYFVDATTTSPSRVSDFVSALVASSNLSASQRSRMKFLASTNAIRQACPSNFKLVSECFGVVIFHYIPSGPQDTQAMNYTIRIDGGRRTVNVDTRMSDYERVSLPLQWAIDKTSMEMMGLENALVPQEWPYTKYANEEVSTKRRLSYINVVQSFLVFVLFFNFLGATYHISGALVDESASGLASLMYVMGCSCVARIISWYLSISLLYLPAWITTAIIWHYRLFSRTNIYLIIGIHVIAGLSLAAFSLVACAPFRKSSQLAAIGTTSLTVLLAIVALFIPANSVAAAFYTLLFPPGFFILAIKAVCRSEMSIWEPHMVNERATLVAVTSAAVANIFIWLFFASILEQWILDPEWPRFSFRSLRLSGPGSMSQSESEPTTVALDGMYAPQASCSRCPLPTSIVLDHIGKDYPPVKRGTPPVTAIRDLSLSIPSRGIFVLLGANGSGKSTMLRMIAGLEKPTSGSIKFWDDGMGVDMEGCPHNRQRGRALGLVPQRDVLFPELTCYQTIRLWRDIKAPCVDSRSPVDSESNPQELERLLGDCDLHAKLHASAATLSGGQKRRLQLAAGLVGGSRIVLIDEATSGVDPLSRRAIWKALGKAREGRSIVFATHFLDEADLLGDEVAILAPPGKLLAQGSPVSLKSNLGDGYAVHVARAPNASSSFDDSVLSLIRVHAPLACLDANERDTYILHSKDAGVAGLVLDTLDKSKEIGVASYSLMGATLENVFLKLMHTAELGSERVTLDIDGHATAARDSGFLSVADTAVTNSSSVYVGSKHGPTIALSSGCTTSPFRQALTGFRKRALIFRRSWLSYALMVIVAVAGACVPIIFTRSRTSTCSPAQDLEKARPLYLPAVASLARPLLGGNATNMYKPVVSPPNLLEALDATSLPHTVVSNTTEFYRTIRQNYGNLSLGGIDIEDGQATIAWEASPGSASGLALLNLANNVLVNQALGERGGPRILAYFQNLPGTKIIGMAPALKWEGFFGASMGLWPAFFALYVTGERRSSVQAMQLSNGVTPVGLWLGHLLFDFSWIVLIATAVTTVLGTATSQFYGLGAFWAIIVLYGVAGALFAYVVSTFGISPLGSFAIAGGYNGMMSMLYGSAYIFTLAYTPSSESKKALEIVHNMGSLLSPIASVVRAAFVSINLFSLLCDGLGGYDHSPPLSMKKFGSPIVYLVGWIIFLFGLLMYIEYDRPIPAWLRPSGSGGVREDPDLEKTMVQRNVFGTEVQAEAVRVRQSQDALRLLDVGKTYSGPFPVLENTSFGVGNEVFALLGPNGAGKTTLLNIIRGNIRPTRGDVLVAGKSVLNEPGAARLSLGVTPQFSSADSQLTVEEHLMIYGSFKGLHGNELKKNVELIMDATALTEYRDRRASKLSGGNARKLSLALALIGNPRVLLIDEYSTGVDPATKRAMWKTLRRVCQDKAVIITTHSMEEAAALASRVGILSKRMLAIGTPDELVSRFPAYEIHFAARTPLEMARVEEVMSRLPGARRVEDVATRYEVPIGQTPLAELFRILGEQNQEQDGMGLEYTVERLGLESVFLKVVREQNEQDK